MCSMWFDSSELLPTTAQLNYMDINYCTVVRKSRTTSNTCQTLRMLLLWYRKTKIVAQVSHDDQEGRYNELFKCLVLSSRWPVTEANTLQYLVVMIRVKHLHVLREPVEVRGGGH